MHVFFLLIFNCVCVCVHACVNECVFSLVILCIINQPNNAVSTAGIYVVVLDKGTKAKGGTVGPLHCQ